MVPVTPGRVSGQGAASDNRLPPRMSRVQAGLVYSPHMPRSGAPQAPQGPGSAPVPERELPATAKTESNFSTFALPHFLQVAAAEPDATIFSNLAPQPRHSYSKIGILCPSRKIYRKVFAVTTANRGQEAAGRGLSHPHFFWLLFACAPENHLTAPCELLRVSPGHHWTDPTNLT